VDEINPALVGLSKLFQVSVLCWHYLLWSLVVIFSELQVS